MDIYKEILDALQQEPCVMLATIISTTGSTPAVALSKMIITHGSSTAVGTIGGGCMEGDVLRHAHQLFNSSKGEILTFHLNEDDIEHGLTCGGSLDVFIEPITRDRISVIQTVKDLSEKGEDCVLATLLGKNGKVEAKIILRPDGSICGGGFDTELENVKSIFSTRKHHNLPSTLEEYVRKLYHRQETTRFKGESGELILEPVSGKPSLIIFGGGHISKYISQAASIVGFRVTIVDDREQYANQMRFPEAVETLDMNFLEALHHLTIKSSTYIIIVTRGHRYDEEILEKIIALPSKYVGMIGSRRKVFTTYERLIERGVDPQQLIRIHAPMGIDIGAVTAEEIGVSVVAELIHTRRREGTQLRHKYEVMDDLLPQLEKRGLPR